jgi:hypothetical protein
MPQKAVISFSAFVHQPVKDLCADCRAGGRRCQQHPLRENGSRQRSSAEQCHSRSKTWAVAIELGRPIAQQRQRPASTLIDRDSGNRRPTRRHPRLGSGASLPSAFKPELGNEEGGATTRSRTNDEKLRIQMTPSGIVIRHSDFVISLVIPGSCPATDRLPHTRRSTPGFCRFSPRRRAAFSRSSNECRWPRRSCREAKRSSARRNAEEVP